MKTALVNCVLLACLALPQGTRLAEPPQLFVLQGGGKELELRIGQPVELPKDLAGQKVTLRVRPNRQFDFQGLKFRYPQSYGWEYEQKEDGPQVVTLSGHTNVLILHFYEDKQDAAKLGERLANSLAAAMGSRTKTSPCELTGAGKRKLAGKRLEGVLAGTRMAQDVYALPLGGVVALLVVQDTLDEQGKPDPETSAMLELLADSLEWPK